MNDFYRIFDTKTANDTFNYEYTEIEPIEELKPYIRCFWGTVGKIRRAVGPPRIVIPDGCMDIIFDVDYESGESSCVFCGVNDSSFYVSRDIEKSSISQFGIRFFMWGVMPLTGCSMREVKNEYVDAEKYFKNFYREVGEEIIHGVDIYDRVRLAQRYLLKRMDEIRLPKVDILNSLNQILRNRGICTIKDLKNYTTLSERSLQRLFKEYIGLSPKKVQGVVRFQNIWRELGEKKSLHLADMAYRYGYSSQGHFINDMKKYCELTPMDIVKR